MGELVGHRKLADLDVTFGMSIWLFLETGKFIFGLGAIPGKIYVKDFGSLSMSSICWPSLENEWRVAPEMMKTISRENDS